MRASGSWPEIVTTIFPKTAHAREFNPAVVPQARPSFPIPLVHKSGVPIEFFWVVVDFRMSVKNRTPSGRLYPLDSAAVKFWATSNVF